MAAGYPSGSNTYIPSFDASGHLVVAYSRNQKDFMINDYITIVPVKKRSGYYLRITPEVAARIVYSALEGSDWPDGNDAPTGEWGLESHEFQLYETARKAYPYRIGYLAQEQADWQILASHGAMYAQLAMTARSLVAKTKLQLSASYATAHSDTAANWGGGFLNAGDNGEIDGPILKKALNAMFFKINKATLGVVKQKDLVAIIDPTIADAFSRSKEIHQYLKESPFALAQVRGDSPSQNGQWGLPDTLYGYKFLVEDAVRITSKKGGTLVQDYLWGGNHLALVARPGALTAAEGSRNFSFLHMFAYEEMTVETKDDPDNRRTNARIIEDWDIRVVSPVAGALCTAVLS